MAEYTQSWLGPWWKGLPPRWGHPWHSMCSYLAMFPPALPRYFIEQCSRPGDVVLDPFSGRGTAPLEACLAGRIGVGSDLNPLAVTLTGAKVQPPTLNASLGRVAELRDSYHRDSVRRRAPAEIEMLFDGRRTMPQLMHARESLRRQRLVDRHLLGVLCGILHGNHPNDPRDSRTLSISMPNTFSMSPGYIKKYARDNGLRKYPLDVFGLLERRLNFLNREKPPSVKGRVAQRDARRLQGFVADGSVDLIFTSPPYLHLVRYGKFNWLRLWLLRQSVEDVDRALNVEATDRGLGLSDRLPLPRYCSFLRDCVESWEGLLRPGGVCALVIGDVRSSDDTHINLAERLWREIRKRSGLELIDIIKDELERDVKVTRIWGSKRGEATKVDRILLLRKPGARRYRARAPQGVLEGLLSESG